MATYRPATTEELADYMKQCPMQLRFRHGVVEQSDPRTESGVRHREYTSARCGVVDGVPQVLGGRRKGERLTATIAILDNGSEVLHDVREAWLKGW